MATLSGQSELLGLAAYSAPPSGILIRAVALASCPLLERSRETKPGATPARPNAANEPPIPPEIDQPFQFGIIGEPVACHSQRKPVHKQYVQTAAQIKGRLALVAHISRAFFDDTEGCACRIFLSHKIIVNHLIYIRNYKYEIAFVLYKYPVTFILFGIFFSGGRMEPTIIWRDQGPVTRGDECQVDLNDRGDAVCVFSCEGTYDLYYILGESFPDSEKIVWDHTSIQKYDKGRFPSIAITNSGLVYEVHEGTIQNDLYYWFGQLNPDTRRIEWWEGPVRYDSGYEPNISAADNGYAVEVHRGAGFKKEDLYYTIFFTDPDKQKLIKKNNQPYDRGSQPSIALTNFRLFVEVHRSKGDGFYLWYRTGVLDWNTNTLEFYSEGFPHYDTGYKPKVAMNDHFAVVEVHQSAHIGSEEIWYHTGDYQPADHTIRWNPSQLFATKGYDHGIALNSFSQVLEIQTKDYQGPNRYDIQASLGNGMHMPTWMETWHVFIGSMAIKDVVLPGTHDSITYDISASSGVAPFADCPNVRGMNWYIAGWSKAQGVDVLQQLNAGIRYFDLRVAKKNEDNGYYFLHCMWSSAVFPELEKIKVFLDENTKEIVILDFNHFYNMVQEDFDLLAQRIVSIFGDLMISSTIPNGVNTTLHELWDDSGRIICFFHGGPSGLARNTRRLFPDLWSGSRIRSPWPNTTDIDYLKAYLTEGLEDREFDPDETIYVSQGVLTPTVQTVTQPFIYGSWSLEAAALKVTPKVTDWIFRHWADLPVNVVIVDWFHVSYFADFCVLLNIYKAFTGNYHTLLTHEYTGDKPKPKRKRKVKKKSAGARKKK